MIRKIWFAIRNLFVRKEMTQDHKNQFLEKFNNGDYDKITGVWDD